MRALFFILFSCLIISCSKPSETLLPELSRAKNLMQEHPDSALAILDSMQIPSPSNQMQYATWCLLHTQAQDKNYIKHTSDSLINIAVSYFKKHDNIRERMLSFYCKGRVESDRHNSEEAVRYYLLAKDIAKETRDYKLLQVICSNLGMSYAYQKLNNLALPEIKEAYNYSIQTKDSINTPYFLSYLGRISAQLNNWDSCIYYYNSAIKIAEESKNLKALSLAYNEISYAYTKLDKYNLAIDYLKKTEKIKEEEKLDGIYQTYLGLGNAFMQIGAYDSASYYLNKSLKADNIYTIKTAYQFLYLINEKQKQFKDAIAYNNLYWIYADSLTNITHTKEVLEIQSKYTQEKLINKNNQLEIENWNILRTALFAFILVICIIALIVFIYQRKLIINERRIQKNKDLIRLFTIELHKNESTISKNEKLIQSLANQLEENIDLKDNYNELAIEIESIREENKSLQEQNKSLKKNLDRYSHTLLAKNDKEMDLFNKLVEQNAYLLEHEKFLSDQLINRIEILSSLKQTPKYITDEQWSEIIEIVNMLYRKYTERLHLDFPSLTEDDLRYCSLIKLRFPISTISTQTGISPSSVTKRKQRIKEKINQSKSAPLGKEQTIESFLWSY